MEVRITRAPLLNCLQRTQNIVEKKTTLPILTNVLIQARSKKLELSATDLEVGIVQVCEASVLREGVATVHARKLFEIVRELPDQEFSFVLKQGQMEIRSGRSVFRLRTLSPEEFPKIPEVKSDRSVRLSTSLLADMIRRVLPSIATDEARYTLTGVLVQMEKKDDKVLLRMISTDSHRLSLCERVLEQNEAIEELSPFGGPDSRHIILPRKGIVEMGSLSEEGQNGEIEFGIHQENAFVKTETFSMLMRLVQGKFPDYRSVIPSQVETVMELEAPLLEQALRRVSVLSTEKSRGVRLAVESGKVIMYSTSPEIGEAQEEIDALYSGEPFEVAFNVKYLMDVLQILTGTIVMKFGKNLKPCLIQDKNDSQYLYVVMPLRL